MPDTWTFLLASTSSTESEVTVTSEPSNQEDSEDTVDDGGGETISLTLTDNQLHNLSLNNFTYTQLAQLAKIGLLALNNATKDTVMASEDDTNASQNEMISNIKLKTESEEGVDPVSPLPHGCSIALLGTLSSEEETVTSGKATTSITGCLGTNSRLTNVDVVR